ncbi:hypothetical protein BC830DRAFT_1073311 [Chytriomyces sp. MP71]|nr:hypothetical protein BC830DRAFT_1073311 [Chytriomyces sp. MP71]
MPRVEDPGHLASTESSPNAPSAPGPGKPLPCLWAADPGTPCLRLFNDPLELYNHLTEAHFVDESETVCRWVSCNTNLRPFAKRDMALSHCWSHVNYKAFACPICGTTFKWYVMHTFMILFRVS